MLKLASSLSKLSLTSSPVISRSPQLNFHTSSALLFQTSEIKWSSVAKKKRKQDPGMLKAKEERRRKRLAKALKKMEKKDRLPKPLAECEIPIILHTERAERIRDINVTDLVKEERILHMKDWSRHCYFRNHNELWKQDKILLTQQMALDELKKESVSLYESAIQFDANLVPIRFNGPVATPPIKDYIQDGEYKETTQTFKVIYEDTDQFMKDLLSRNRKKKKKSADEEE